MTQTCCLIKLDRGCLILGYLTLLFSTAVTILALLNLAHELRPSFVQDSASNITSPHELHLHLNEKSIKVILGIVVITGLFWMIFSAVLIIGILNNNSGCVMSYFLCGVSVSILLLLSGLLELINQWWPIAIVTFVCTCIYLKCLTYVYYAYDQLSRGKVFGDNGHLNLDEQLIIDEESS